MPKNGKHLNCEFDGNKLKLLLKQRGLTQTGFANMLGITSSTINSYLTGHKKPSVSLNKLICISLDVPENEFLIESEPPKPEPLTEPVQDNHALEEAVDKLTVYLERIERKQDRLEMLIRSVQNENLKLHQTLLKLKTK